MHPGYQLQKVFLRQISRKSNRKPHRFPNGRFLNNAPFLGKGTPRRATGFFRGLRAPDVFRALTQPGFETGSQTPPGGLMEGSGLPLKAEARSIGVLFGCFGKRIDGDSWFTRWFTHLPGPPGGEVGFGFFPFYFFLAWGGPAWNPPLRRSKVEIGKKTSGSFFPISPGGGTPLKNILMLRRNATDRHNLPFQALVPVHDICQTPFCTSQSSITGIYWLGHVTNACGRKTARAP